MGDLRQRREQAAMQDVVQVVSLHLSVGDKQALQEILVVPLHPRQPEPHESPLIPVVDCHVHPHCAPSSENDDPALLALDELEVANKEVLVLLDRCQTLNDTVLHHVAWIAKGGDDGKQFCGTVCAFMFSDVPNDDVDCRLLQASQLALGNPFEQRQDIRVSLVQQNQLDVGDGVRQINVSVTEDGVDVRDGSKPAGIKNVFEAPCVLHCKLRNGPENKAFSFVRIINCHFVLFYFFLFIFFQKKECQMKMQKSK
jgi:hypothetical protein